MAVVYDYVKGRKLEKLIAQHEETQDALVGLAANVASRAASNLSQHRHDGHARIEVARDEERPDIDWNVVLTDEAGLGSAMSMEYGRPEGTTSSWGPMRPLWILHRAAGIPTPSTGG